MTVLRSNSEAMRFPFQTPFEAGNQFNAGVLSQSASSNHALLITKSALLIKKKMPSVLANQHSVILPCMW